MDRRNLIEHYMLAKDDKEKKFITRYIYELEKTHKIIIGIK